MATVHVVSVGVLDDGGNAGSIPFYVPSTATIAQVQAWLDAMLPNLDTVTGAKINRASVSLALDVVAGLKATAIVDHPLQYGGLFSFSADGTPYRQSVYVPAIDQGIVTGEEVDTSPQFVVDWLADLVTGDGTVAPSDKYGNDLTAFLEARVKFRK